MNPSHGLTRGAFLRQSVLRPLPLPSGFHARLCLLPQHPAGWKPDLGRDILAKEIGVASSRIRVRNGEQRRARFLQVARERTAVEAESLSEN